MTKLILTVLILFSYISPAAADTSPGLAFQNVTTAVQASDTSDADLELARRYTPVLYFHPDEIYYPQPVDLVLGLSRLRQSRKMWFDTTVLAATSLQDLLTVPTDGTYFLDQWFGDTGSSEYGNIATHQNIYETIFSPHAGGPQPVTYAHVVRSEDPQYITIQYWLYYFYNDWFNKHEGDWEMVELVLTKDNQPQWVIYSQHHGGVRRLWEATQTEEGTHPVVYVARGSHANYFVGNEVYPFKKDIGTKQLVLVDRTGIDERWMPGVILIPSREELALDPNRWPGAEWLMFHGRWGETAVYGDLNGPYGPADKGLQWDQPLAWGMDQPLDQDTWFKNRLRAEITGPAGIQAHIQLIDDRGQILPQAESIGNLAILHSNSLGRVLAIIDGPPGLRGDVTISWPDEENKTVTQAVFSGFVLDASGRARLELSAGKAVLLSAASRLSLLSSMVSTNKPVWDGPDTVLVGNHMPIHEILGGLVLSLLMSLVPILALILILYWVDRYHKEPVRMLAIAFLWGAIPALVVALALQVFFKLPPGVMGPNALEAIRLGFLAPVLEETLKGAGVLIIYWRGRKEINDVLDGMIYGAMVGFGFAFVSNFSRYAGNFIALGYPGLSTSVIAERTVNALDHGLYSGIFGAGLGYAMLAKKRPQFWLRTFAGLGLAVATHALHNLLANSLVGLNVLTVLVTVAGTLLLWVVAGWSLVQQRRLLQSELQGLVHDSLYDSVLSPVRRTRAQWQALRREGFRAWIQMRQLQALCIRLATAQFQVRMHPEKTARAGDINALQVEIKQAYNRLSSTLTSHP